MEKEFLPGETVLLAGDLSPYLFLIKRGSVKLEGNGECFFLSEDDFFGEEGCFFGKPSRFSVTVGEETLLQLMESAEITHLSFAQTMLNPRERHCALIVAASARITFAHWWTKPNMDLIVL